MARQGRQIVDIARPRFLAILAVGEMVTAQPGRRHERFERTQGAFPAKPGLLRIDLLEAQDIGVGALQLCAQHLDSRL